MKWKNITNNETVSLLGPSESISAHYALVTGKGRSVYKSIFGINIYTSWDIVNCWENVSYYRPDKYWVDNQYIYFGYVLRNSNGDTVAL